MFSKILLPIDLASEHSWKKPLRLAVEIARHGGAEIHVMAVLPDFGLSVIGSYFDKDFEGAALKDMTGDVRQWVRRHIPSEVKATPHVAHGAIYDEILRAADKLGCDAIVMGAHRPELKDYLLGPNAARVVRHATQSVLVVRD